MILDNPFGFHHADKNSIGNFGFKKKKILPDICDIKIQTRTKLSITMQVKVEIDVHIKRKKTVSLLGYHSYKNFIAKIFLKILKKKCFFKHKNT